MKKEHLKLAVVVLAGGLLLAAVPASAKADTSAEVTEYITGTENHFSAGAHLAMGETIVLNDKNQMQASDIKENDTPSVGAAEDTANIDNSENTENTEEAPASEYANIAIAQVELYLNIRAEANADAEVLGKLYNRDAAIVLEDLDGWYKVTSGNVTGYISEDYVVVGNEELCKKFSERVGTVTTETLKLRKEASTEAEVLTLLVQGKEVTVLDEAKEGWYQVTDGNYTGYVSAEYLTVEARYSYAESKEEEAARLAAEEAKRRAEAERQAAEEAARREAEAQKNKKPSSNKTYSEPTGSDGRAVADYACQFVGNPYVWGGESLTKGADCSGFVKAVYAKFGISLPHSSYSLRSVGYAVSESELQPGDIICYSGHVAIYIGDGQIVHASNAKSGIKISTYNYRTIVAIRRVL